MITSKFSKMFTNTIPSEFQFESRFYQINMTSAISECIPEVAFRHCGCISE